MEIIKKFTRGDLVQLKSGGPTMTVDEYDMWHDIMGAFVGKDSQPSHETEVVKCTWFDKTQRKFGKFHQDLLKPIVL
ncbi:MAG: DUF2158 domain-containing protein [Ferruginibacter sp.]